MLQTQLLPPYIAYYMHLDKPSIVDKLRYRFKGKSIVYGIRCRLTGKIYIGSTMLSATRFYNHLIAGQHSNEALQNAIKQFGLQHFVAHVFEVVEYPDGLTFHERKAYLLGREQVYLDKFSKSKLYNTRNSSAS
jgi:group I intron endonuclease